MILPATLPDYLPARMLNEFVYCPRLFYYEWVEGQFRNNTETVEGSIGHRRVDRGRGELAPADDLPAEGETFHARSVQLSSEQHRLIAKMDLIEADGETVTPVDYKRGAPRQSSETGELTAWDADRVQVAAQAIILREHGYRVDEAVLYYQKTKQRVRVAIDDALVTARDDLRPLYLNTQGLVVGKSGQVLKIKEKDKVVQEVRIGEICQLNLYNAIQMTTQAIQALCEEEVPIAYFSLGGWFYGVTQGLGVKNIFLRREQFRLAEVASYCLRLARAMVAGKIRNQRTLLQRNHVEPPAYPLALMKQFAEDAEGAESLEQLLGIEGNGARVYFEHFSGMIKREEDDPFGESRPAEFRLDFRHRNRRPPRDPVNALLSLAYSMLAKDLTIITQAVGFDPFLGFYHQPRFGRPSLALDLMEPFRP